MKWHLVYFVQGFMHSLWWLQSPEIITCNSVLDPLAHAIISMLVLAWSLNTNEVREVAAMANFNLNETQSLNDALRAVYMEEEGGGDFVALCGAVRNQPYLLFPHTYGL